MSESQAVWKFVLDVKASNHEGVSVEMPVAAQILSVGEQDGRTCLWALVYPDSKCETRRFIVAGTGQVLPAVPITFLGSGHLSDGQYVFHVFERFDTPARAGGAGAGAQAERAS